MMRRNGSLWLETDTIEAYDYFPRELDAESVGHLTLHCKKGSSHVWAKS